VVAGATAYPRLIDFAAFREIADEVDAYLLVDAAHLVGLVAGGAVPSPVPHADVVSFSTHKVLRGPRGGLILCRAELAQRIDKAVFPFLQGGPLMHVIAAKAVALGEALRPAFRQYTRQVVANAAALAAELAAAGMRPVSGGTDTHLALLDLTELGVTGQQAERRAEAGGITVTQNGGPFDPRPPPMAPRVPGGPPAGAPPGQDGAGDGGDRRAARPGGTGVGARPGAGRRGDRAGPAVPGLPPPGAGPCVSTCWCCASPARSPTWPPRWSAWRRSAGGR